MSENETPQGAENGHMPQGATPVVPQDTAQVPPYTGAAVPPPPTYQVPPQQTYAQPQMQQPKTRSAGFGSVQKEKWPAVILALPPFGALGLHKFYLGYKTEGLIMLLVTLVGSLCFGLGPAVMYVISVIELVKYVTLTPEDFDNTYVQNYKGWL